MKLYNGLSPNGARVKIFLAEKGVEIPVKPVQVPAGDTRTDAFLKINPLGEIPVLELDDGSVLTESVAICRYIESLHPSPNLFGEDAVSQARIEMWNRRMELRIFNAIGDVALHEFEFFKSRGQVPEYAAFMRKRFADNLVWLDQEFSDGRTFVAGEQFSVADITGMAMLMLTLFAQYEIPMDLTHLRKWSEAMLQRPSFPKLPSGA